MVRDQVCNIVEMSLCGAYAIVADERTYGQSDNRELWKGPKTLTATRADVRGVYEEVAFLLK